MSKRVSAEYLARVSKAASTLTVYFTDESQLRGFMSSAETEYGSRVSCIRGFDYVTFMGMERGIIDGLESDARTKGFDTSEF